MADAEAEAEKVQQALAAFTTEQMGALAAKIETAIGRSLPRVEVRFQGLSIAADVAIVDTSCHENVSATPELPTLFNVAKRALLTKLAVKKRVERHQILHPMTGAFKPGTITLILGQPGSGKSSLLKVLSGRFPMEKNVVLEGSISFNGKSLRDLTAFLPQVVSYVNQHDRHFPTLTVRETFQFAHACCGSEMKAKETEWFAKGTAEQNESALSMARMLIEHFPDVIIQQLGLQTCQDTVVGDAMIRGISGGQRKRVTTGEMQFGKKNVMLMDEISTGLDSAATFDIVKTQRALAKEFRKTTVISLLQPSPEVFGLFDNVLILNEGHVTYHGPIDKVEAYFNSLGFVCPERRDVADFLLDLGTDQQQQYQVPLPEGSTKKHPRSAAEFADAFKQSEIHTSMITTACAPLDPVLETDMKEYVGKKNEFFQSFWGSTKTLMAREVVILKRNTMFLLGRLIMTVIMGILYGTTYFQFNPLQVQVVMGLLFSATLFLSLGQMAQIPTIMDARDVFYKQRGANFYRTLSYVLAFSVSKIPLAIGESLLFGTLVYWMCGFVTFGGAYVIFEVMLTLTNMAFTSWFFFVASASPNLHIAKPLSMVSVLIFVLFAGFIITKDQLPVYVRWLYWIDPVAWCLRALAVNQYRDDSLDKCEYKGVNYCELFGLKTGEYYLTLYGVPTEKYWVGYGIIFMIFTYFAFIIISYIVLEYKRFETAEHHGTATQTDEDETAELLTARQTPSQREASRGKVVVAPAEGNGKVAPVQSKGSLATAPVTLAFKDIWYSVPDPANPKESIDLLQGVTGYAAPGSMTALMGSSGAGKTTLMDVIAGRKTGGKIRGEILLNGHKASRLAIRRCTGYCEQMDIHSEASTIREALVFSAFLRLSSDIPDSAKLDSVRECITLLDLKPIADQIIRGSSTEQMKRLTIGVELAARPSVLFLDEPTSGLDARSAKRIMDGVRRVADSGRTVVCTIHQPSSEVFQLFDRLLLLKRGGETVFYGDLGAECVNLIKYFEEIPGVTTISHGYNPATWMLECIGAGVGSSGPGGSAVTNFAELFKKSELKTALDAHIDKPGVGHPSPEFPALTFNRTFAATPATQMRMLIKRFFDMYWRTASYNLTRLAISVMLALIFGIIYTGADYRTYQGVNSAVGMIFCTTLFNAMVSFNSGLPIACEERATFYREQASQMYHPFWYFLGATLAEIPYVLASALLFSVVFLPMVGFPGFVNGLLYWINVSLIVLLMTYVGQLLAYAMPSLEVAMIAGALMSSIQGLFMGFNPPASSIPIAYKWIYYLTPQRYIMGNLVGIALGNCPTPGGDEIGCQILQKGPVSLGTITVKEYVELVFAMKHSEIATNMGIIIGFIVAFRTFAFLSLRYINHQKR